jgi:hypothetical protein
MHLWVYQLRSRRQSQPEDPNIGTALHLCSFRAVAVRLALIGRTGSDICVFTRIMGTMDLRSAIGRFSARVAHPDGWLDSLNAEIWTG